MGDMSLDNLSSQYFDVLKELGNIGAGNATTALAQMIGTKVDVTFFVHLITVGFNKPEVLFPFFGRDGGEHASRHPLET